MAKEYTMETCAYCGGKGEVETGTCQSCGGEGKVKVTNPPRKCHYCKGKGVLLPPNPCTVCKGTGWKLYRG